MPNETKQPTKPAANAKHTPGPWYATEPHDEMVLVTAPGVVSGGSHTVVAVHAYHLALTEEERANARLIAASPTMHKALIFCVQAMRTAGVDAIPGGICAQAVAEARAILAAIEGA